MNFHNLDVVKEALYAVDWSGGIMWVVKAVIAVLLVRWVWSVYLEPLAKRRKASKKLSCHIMQVSWKAEYFHVTNTKQWHDGERWDVHLLSFWNIGRHPIPYQDLESIFCFTGISNGVIAWWPIRVKPKGLSTEGVFKTFKYGHPLYPHKAASALLCTNRGELVSLEVSQAPDMVTSRKKKLPVEVINDLREMGCPFV